MAHGLSEKWRGAGDDIPRELGKDEFERWLWRKGIVEVSQYADLRSETDFPPFDGLPEKEDIDLGFYESEDGFSYRPRKHWCFLAEIIDVEEFVRLRLVVKDKTDCTIPIAFYTDGRGLELDPSRVRRGFTVAILYAEQHGFLDLSVGIRHENPTAIKIFPLPLDELLILSDKVQEYSRELKGVKTCQGCNKKAASLQKCSRCGLFWYCNKSCQITGWKENGHKADCKLLKDPDLQRLFLTKWDAFEDPIDFAPIS
ncbi:MAG: hypothetical protein M1840_002137 [Geoglossum simile]|nr:MAG: hypothetical protein M1840_002137 [Geoglossum simile]